MISTNPNPDPNQLPPFCRRANAFRQCLECYDRYYLDAGTCYKVDDQCKTFNTATGACLSCFGGYRISGNACVIDTSGGGGGNQNGIANCLRAVNGVC